MEKSQPQTALILAGWHRLRATRKFLFLALFAGALLYAMGWWMGAPSEPVYKGRKLSAWLRATRYSGELDSGKLRAMGADAVKWLIWTAEHGAREEFGKEPVGLAERTRQQIRKILHRDASEDFDEREQAIWALSEFGPDAAPAIPMLERMLRDPSGQYAYAAGHTLMNIGLAARQVIEDRMRDGTFKARLALAQAARFEFPNDTSALSSADIEWYLQFLERACADREREVREMAVLGLFQQARGPSVTDARKEVLPILRRLLRESAPDVCRIALHAFPPSSPEAVATIPRLAELLDHPNATLRSDAAGILAQMASDPNPTVRLPAREAIRNRPVPDDR